MVHGQAIGIPFRRRKGEQAPPPPKEVAWNPTIESNLPYKEAALVDFVVLVIRVLEIVLPSPRFRNIKMASYLMEKPLILKI